MISFAEQLEVPCAPDIAFELLADMAELDRWNPNVPSSRRVSGERFEPGSRYQSVLARGPIRLTARSELVTVEPGRRVEYQGSIAWFWSVDSMEFVADGNGTRIAFRNETTGPQWIGPFTRTLNALFQRQARRAVAGAARYLAANMSGG